MQLNKSMAGRGTDILLGGNASMMTRLKMREVLFAKLFPSSNKSWKMPEDFYPIKPSSGTQAKLNEAVDACFATWTQFDALKPNNTEDAYYYYYYYYCYMFVMMFIISMRLLVVLFT